MLIVIHSLQSQSQDNVNLTVHASKEPLGRSMMDTVQHIAFSFDYLAQPQRLHVFQVELELKEDAQAGMNNRSNMQSFYVTRSCERSVYIHVCVH